MRFHQPYPGIEYVSRTVRVGITPTLTITVIVVVFNWLENEELVDSFEVKSSQNVGTTNCSLTFLTHRFTMGIASNVAYSRWIKVGK